MTTKGYMGKLLTIDLSNRSVDVEGLSDDMARRFIGGSGLGAKVLHEQTSRVTDPLDPDNVLVFATGPVNGSSAFNSDRFDVVFKSPLTGIFAESNAGGYWGGKLKRSGYDAVIIRGKSEDPVYLYIDEEKVEFHGADELWGQDTFAATETLQKRHGGCCKAAVIGPAGESLVSYANIISDGHHGRAVGRCGGGAVMGSKNLKAVVANGHQNPTFHDIDAIRALNKRLASTMKTGPVPLRDAGTSCGLDYCEEIGNHPIRNWYQGNWKEGVQKITGYAMVREKLVGRYGCGNCAIRCGRIVKAEGGPYSGQEIAGPEYETLSLLGSNCLNDDLGSIIKANELCNRYGLDTISAGNVIGFVMEAHERGLITKRELEGLNADWGHGEAVIDFIHRIAKREGIGRLLGEGVRSIARTLGGIAAEFAVEVKGLEPPAHDPRALFTVALGFATANRGACHLAAFSHDFEENGYIEDIGLPRMTDRFATEGKAENVIRLQNLMSMFDSLTMCKFSLFGGITVNPLVEYVRSATGWDMSVEEFFNTGERIFNVKRIYNVKHGISRKDDTLPPRLLYHRKGGGTDRIPPLNLMLSDYYRQRGWDEFGIPSPETVDRLDLRGLA